MSKLVDVTEMKIDKETVLSAENEALKQTIELLHKEIDRLKGGKKSATIALKLLPEEEIIYTQIQNLLFDSRNRKLNMEETKQLDFYIKNKRLIEEKSTVNADFKNLPDDISDDELNKIAEGTIDVITDSIQSSSEEDSVE